MFSFTDNRSKLIRSASGLVVGRCWGGFGEGAGALKVSMTPGIEGIEGILGRLMATTLDESEIYWSRRFSIPLISLRRDLRSSDMRIHTTTRAVGWWGEVKTLAPHTISLC